MSGAAVARGRGFRRRLRGGRLVVTVLPQHAPVGDEAQRYRLARHFQGHRRHHRVLDSYRLQPTQTRLQSDSHLGKRCDHFPRNDDGVVVRVAHQRQSDGIREAHADNALVFSRLARRKPERQDAGDLTGGEWRKIGHGMDEDWRDHLRAAHAPGLERLHILWRQLPAGHIHKRAVSREDRRPRIDLRPIHETRPLQHCPCDPGRPARFEIHFLRQVPNGEQGRHICVPADFREVLWDVVERARPNDAVDPARRDLRRGHERRPLNSERRATDVQKPT